MRVLTGHNFLQGGHTLAGHGLSSADGALSAYAVAGVLPSYVMDTENGIYYDGTYYDGPNQLHDHATTSNRTVVDSDGLVKWAPHNVFTFSETLSDASWVTAFLSNGTRTNGAISISDPEGYVYIGKNNVTLPAGANTIAAIITSDTTVTDVPIRALHSVAASQLVDFVAGVPKLVEIEITLSSATTTTTAFGIDARSAIAPGGSNETGYTLTFNYMRSYRSDLGGMQTTGNATDPTYVPTAGSAVYWMGTDHDPVTGEVLGVQGEPAATNKWILSNNFTGVSVASSLSVANNQTNGPDGNTSLGRISFGAEVDDEHSFNRTITTPTAGVHEVLSVWALADEVDQVFFRASSVSGSGYTNVTFSLASGAVTATGAGWNVAGIEDYGGGLYRCWANMTSRNQPFVAIGLADTAGDHTMDGTGRLGEGLYTSFIQVEETSAATNGPTSYIPTSGATATRAAPSVSKPLSEVSADLDEIVVVTEFECADVAADAVVAALDDASTDLIHFRAHTSQANLFVQDGGVTQADVDAGAISANTQYRAAFKMAADDFLASLGGATAVADTSGTMPTPTTLRLFNSSGAAPLTGIRVKKLIVYAGAAGALDAIDATALEGAAA